jgi:murein DD-endopeptidase MepM/ murein hydrolase activator NlpD
MRIVAFRVFRLRSLARWAALMSVVAATGLAGCSSQTTRFDGYGYDNGYSGSYAYTTASLTPAYDSPPQYGNGSRGYGLAYNGGASYPNNYDTYGSIGRSNLPPLNGNGIHDRENGYGNNTYADGYGRYNRHSIYGNGGYADPGRESDYGGSYHGGSRRHGGYGAQEAEHQDDGNGYNRSGRDNRARGYNGEAARITVAPGDTLYGLALRYGVSVDDIIYANSLSNHNIRVGQELVIPETGNRFRRSSNDYGPRYNGSSYAVTDTRSRGPRGAMQDDPRDCPNCYTVKAGDSLFSIGKAHGLGPAHIAHYNNIPVTAKLKPGQQLRIPGNALVANARGREGYYANRPENMRPPVRYAASRTDASADDNARNAIRAPRGEGGSEGAADGRPQTPRIAGGADTSAAPTQRVAATPPAKAEDMASAPSQSCDELLARPMPRSGETFRRPVEGLVISKFGPKEDGTYNDGINIAVPRGTPVKAAENGVVTYVGTEIAGFGNLILIRHADDYVTAYAHNDEVKVKRCDVVRRGQEIATAGATGSVSKPQLHFEIRKNSKPVDPEQHFASLDR